MFGVDAFTVPCQSFFLLHALACSKVILVGISMFDLFLLDVWMVEYELPGARSHQILFPLV